jgi:hypothetical protein
VDIQILLQPAFAQKDLPHRFLVQAVGCGDANLSKTEWSALKKDEIYEQRLTVVDTPSESRGAAGSPSDNVSAADLQTKYGA